MLDIPNLQSNVILAPYTTYKIGGSADFIIVVKNKDELTAAIIAARKNKIPFFVLGTGANILFGDKGFRGLVIKNEANHFSIRGNTLIAESGTIMSNLIQETACRELSGFEHFAGIPSTVGGALWQNLHFLSPDRSRTVFIEEFFVSAKVLNEKNEVQVINKKSFNFAYDYSVLHDKKYIVLEAIFELVSDKKNNIQNQVKENLAWRAKKQPPIEIYPSCGSVFKKVKDVGAGRLIEQVGLKGKKIGDIQVSEKHANFLINKGNGKASDVKLLIELIQKEVKEKTGYEIFPEISLIGEF